MSEINVPPCPFCGKTEIGIKEELLDINFEYGNTIKIVPYCKHCGATGRSRTIRECNSDVKAQLALNSWSERFLFSDAVTKWNSNSNCTDTVCCDIPIGQLCCFQPLYSQQNENEILFGHMAGMVVDRFEDMSFMYVLQGADRPYFSRKVIICPPDVKNASDAKKYFKK